MAGALEEKAVDLKGRKRREGGKTKEKDIMKRRQEGGEEEKKMGTDEKGVEKEKRRGIEEGKKGIAEREEERKENGECGTKDVPPPPLRTHSLAKS